MSGRWCVAGAETVRSHGVVFNSGPFDAATALLRYVSAGMCRTQYLDTFYIATLRDGI